MPKVGLIVSNQAFSLALLFAFLIGSVPFSPILVWVFFKKDTRNFGEGNPGAANAFRAAGPYIGWSVLWLDFLKGALPVYFLTQSANAWQLPMIAIAPVLGHAFSPFLRFSGGKAITTSFGIWTGLTLWQGPVALGLGAIISILLFKKASDFLKAATVFLALAALLLIIKASAGLWSVFAANTAIIAIKQMQYANKGRQ